MLKYEFRPLSGAIKDIVWSPDSKRIVVAGEGRDVSGIIHPLIFNTLLRLCVSVSGLDTHSCGTLALPLVKL